MTLGHQGSERDNIRASHHPPKVAGRHALSGNCPVYLFGHYQTKQADSDPNCDEMRRPAKGGTFLSSIESSLANESEGRHKLLLQETTVEDKSPSDKAKYSIVDV